jgi:uncharacterized membrane protein
MTLYDVLLFLHLVGVSVWVGGSIMLGFISSRVERTGDVEFRVRFGKAAGVVGPIIGVSAVVVLGAGVGMVLESDAVALPQLWVWLSLALFILSAIVGAVYFAPASDRIVKALEAGRVEEADRQARTFNMVSWLDLLLLLVIMGIMVFKAGL